MPLESKMAPPRGSLAPIDIQWEKHKKIFFSETTRPRAFIVVLFINRAPGVLMGLAPGASWEKHKKKSSSPKPQGTELSYFV